MRATSPARQLEGFIDRYSPDVAKVARQALRLLRPRLRGAYELVYDNYNALAIGFSPSDRASDVVVSVALYPRWVSLFFMRGATLPDPSGLLRGRGKHVRHFKLESAADVKTHGIQLLIQQAIEQSPRRFSPSLTATLVIKSISANQRARRPPDR